MKKYAPTDIAICIVLPLPVFIRTEAGSAASSMLQNGLKILFSQEHNARINAVAAVMAVSLAIILGFDRTGWVAVLISIAAVFITESVNSAVERLCDLVMPQYSRQVKEIKDLAAGAVLISSG